MNEILAHYLIIDGGVGSADLVLFKTQEALDLYLELDEKFSYNNYDLSKGGKILTTNWIATAMDEEAVRRSFQ